MSITDRYVNGKIDSDYYIEPNEDTANGFYYKVVCSNTGKTIAKFATHGEARRKIWELEEIKENKMGCPMDNLKNKMKEITSLIDEFEGFKKNGSLDKTMDLQLESLYNELEKLVEEEKKLNLQITLDGDDVVEVRTLDEDEIIDFDDVEDFANEEIEDELIEIIDDDLNEEAAFDADVDEISLYKLAEKALKAQNKSKDNKDKIVKLIRKYTDAKTFPIATLTKDQLKELSDLVDSLSDDEEIEIIEDDASSILQSLLVKYLSAPRKNLDPAIASEYGIPKKAVDNLKASKNVKYDVKNIFEKLLSKIDLDSLKDWVNNIAVYENDDLEDDLLIEEDDEDLDLDIEDFETEDEEEPTDEDLFGDTDESFADIDLETEEEPTDEDLFGEEESETEDEDLFAEPEEEVTIDKEVLVNNLVDGFSYAAENNNYIPEFFNEEITSDAIKEWAVDILADQTALNEGADNFGLPLDKFKQYLADVIENVEDVTNLLQDKVANIIANKPSEEVPEETSTEETGGEEELFGGEEEAPEEAAPAEENEEEFF